jgi:SAM-dependent methyltransferase
MSSPRSPDDLAGEIAPDAASPITHRPPSSDWTEVVRRRSETRRGRDEPGEEARVERRDAPGDEARVERRDAPGEEARVERRDARPVPAAVARLDRTFYPDTPKGWDDDLFRDAIRRHIDGETVMLDLGAGRGANPRLRFKDEVREICGVDVDPIVLENTDVHDARVIEADGRIPHEDDRFDCIVSSYVLEHVEDPATFFAEVARVLRPGGVFVSRTPNRLHYVALIATLTPQRFHVWVNEKRGRPGLDTFPTFYRANTPNAVRRWAARAGLTVDEISRHEGRPEYLRFNALTYAAGIAYERIASSGRLFEWMRPLMISVLRKPARR